MQVDRSLIGCLFEVELLQSDIGFPFGVPSPPDPRKSKHRPTLVDVVPIKRGTRYPVAETRAQPEAKPLAPEHEQGAKCLVGLHGSQSLEGDMVLSLISDCPTETANLGLPLVPFYPFLGRVPLLKQTTEKRVLLF